MCQNKVDPEQVSVVASLVMKPGLTDKGDPEQMSVVASLVVKSMALPEYDGKMKHHILTQLSDGLAAATAIHTLVLCYYVTLFISSFSFVLLLSL